MDIDHECFVLGSWSISKNQGDNWEQVYNYNQPLVLLGQGIVTIESHSNSKVDGRVGWQKKNMTARKGCKNMSTGQGSH